MAAESLMVLYGDDSVEVHYAGGSRLLLSPCGCEYLYEAALPAAAHPLRPAETTRQRVAFAVSAYRVGGQAVRRCGEGEEGPLSWKPPRWRVAGLPPGREAAAARGAGTASPLLHRRNGVVVALCNGGGFLSLCSRKEDDEISLKFYHCMCSFVLFFIVFL